MELTESQNESQQGLYIQKSEKKNGHLSKRLTRSWVEEVIGTLLGGEKKLDERSIAGDHGAGSLLIPLTESSTDYSNLQKYVPTFSYVSRIS